MNTVDKGYSSPWSGLNHEVLFLVMMQLGVFDFLAFGRVCKSWRSLALSNKSRFLAFKPPMQIGMTGRFNKRDDYIVDSEGRRFKIPLPNSRGRTFLGLTCGYLVLIGRRPFDFWLLNSITRHGLHFPQLPKDVNVPEPMLGVRAILAFSSSMSVWIFVISCWGTNKIWFSIVGKGAWNYVSRDYIILDIHEFKGKMYVLDKRGCLYEFVLDTEPKLTLLKTKNNPDHMAFKEFVCSDEKLFATGKNDRYQVHELDFGEMQWVLPEEKTIQEHAFFVSNLKRNSAVVKTGFCSDSWWRYKENGHAYQDISMFHTIDLWYFLIDCLKVNSQT